MTRSDARQPWRISVTLTVVTLFTTLSLLGIGTVLVIGFIGAAQNTQSLIDERTATVLRSTLYVFQQYTAPVRQAMDDAAGEIADGRLDLNRESAVRRFSAGVLAVVPHVSGIVLLRPDLRVESFLRDKVERQGPIPEAVARKALGRADRATGSWFMPVWSQTRREPALSLQTPFRGPGDSTGLLLTEITLDDLSRRVAELSRYLHQPVFIIYNKRFVVAHPRPPTGGVTANDAKPLLTLAEYGDPVLAQIWNAAVVLVPSGRFGSNIGARRLVTPEGEYGFIYHIVAAGGGNSFTIGTYYVGSLAEVELTRLHHMLFGGLGTLLLAVGVTVIAGRRVSRPILVLAAAAREIEKHQFDRFQLVPRTRIREIDEAGQAFNQMVEGLRERQRIRDLFGKYVPNEVVEQLIANPQEFALGGTRREISLLFTDIADFTALSEKVPSETVLDLLNAYFEGITGCITQQGGIVVDFIGDAVFAIFGAPVAHADHARRGFTCAREIDRFARAFAAEQQAQGIPFGRTRIGLHTGAATVGTMGSRDRLKYGAVGDVVNTASRLEGANTLFNTHLLASGQTVRGAGDSLCRPVGRLVLKGRTAAVEVYEVLSEAEADGGWLESYGHAYDAVERNPAEARAEFSALAKSRPGDMVIRFHLDRLDRGVGSVVVEMIEK